MFDFGIPSSWGQRHRSQLSARCVAFRRLVWWLHLAAAETVGSSWYGSSSLVVGFDHDPVMLYASCVTLWIRSLGSPRLATMRDSGRRLLCFALGWAVQSRCPILPTSVRRHAGRICSRVTYVHLSARAHRLPAVRLHTVVDTTRYLTS
ncbi:uncharacterized protein LY79DRAFT_354784 [Colletotrichum navitas]|uniref:Uncharacterized protein n=1 Tax=Colletotrichum navitas TaxID=681940 RepID=A0AAD8Q829_9PEZI|nr:uncharacterized protein LY79DRAFT_354784 [Colletotrichum navitas]KAK1597728.1 hypothetical protein LY79DRAFT_354784 [Colletotrichum navitas]